MWPHDTRPQDTAAAAQAPPTGAQKQADSSLIDQTRRLAVRRCILTCLANGWAPSAESVWRLVALREAYQRGEHREDTITQEGLARLLFVRWLYQGGRISDL